MYQPLTHHRRKGRKKSERSRDAFLAMVSHELLTPTTAIIGWATLARDDRTDDEIVAHAVRAIERCARLQKQLIEQLLDYSRVNHGCLRLDARKTSLAPILEVAVDTMMPLAKAKEIDLRVNLDASAGVVIGDPARLQQVITNLLANAIKFTPSGGRVDVRLEGFGSSADVTVSDTGRGVPAEFLPYIFDPFRQADTRPAITYDGLGLGLAISRHIVERHGGKIHAESLGEGKGTTFTVSLPVEDENVTTNLQS